MLLLEHDAKAALEARGVPVPAGAWFEAGDAPPALPCMIKAQVPAGGRGKAGGIRRAETAQQADTHRAAIVGLTIGGHRVLGCRAEAVIENGHEVYLGFTLDAAAGKVRVMLSEAGGIDVEDAGDAMHHALAAPAPHALAAAVDGLAEALPDDLQAAARDAGRIIGKTFLDLDALLLEINPLMLLPDGGWVAADVRLAIDTDALPRQPDLAALLEARPQAYGDALFKRHQGYDLIVIDPKGEVGLVTTGAGLSMKLIDEMTEQGVRPYNFCDIRSGQMRGDPARLIGAFQVMARAPRLKAVLVNIFAGVTDLGEFAELLLTALKAVPELEAPIVARLAGNGQERAAAILTGSGVTLEQNLDRAVALVSNHARQGADA
ncbi:ATP-grasp domain-containing protein [Alkalilacustris brevis]|uniref:ATP-grasp domain-containing protein n=1 Tax=Alkalilacustris brevis TaxID=2026338 RepID=UPI0013904CD0|nr:ATP-grasp domain-containing protein [Alkalilacustris brevis]